MTGKDAPDRKNLILLFYVLGLATLNFALYSFRSESEFFFGAFEILMVFLFPFGALIYGYGTGDRARSIAAGTLSYASFILTAFFAMGSLNSFEDQNYLFQFAGYHLLLLLILGLIGFFASDRQRSSRVVALILSVLWVLAFFSGIT